jgi:hypothetical protein
MVCCGEGNQQEISVGEERVDIEDEVQIELGL